MTDFFRFMRLCLQALLHTRGRFCKTCLPAMADSVQVSVFYGGSQANKRAAAFTKQRLFKNIH
jgi:hypothetical protein